ncbi:dedicator of cytokinesis protein 3-like [Amphibalanus amphitrite]|uniref:dedicator of cytokinesis protein 3-like n=1 Tax=Amphibalanus amphitrite TaxID=1232801 RepID=UPI001C92045A|nr:dedicator of cytokinesis protein 3-like [Amphibalanus amphitrite]
MWTKRTERKLGVAVYSWAGCVRHGLPLCIGDTVHILEECGGWYRGYTVRHRGRRGLFPASYVQLKPCRVETDGPQELITAIEDGVVTEVTQVLREWSEKWKQLFVDRESLEVSSLWKVMHELLDWRRQLLTGTLTQDQTRELRVRVTAKIDWGNRQLGLDLVPRVDGCMVDPDLLSVVALHQVHTQSLETSQGMSIRGTLRKKDTKQAAAHNLHLALRDFVYFTGEDAQLFFSLYDAKRARFVSERFLVEIARDGASNFYNKPANNASTVFTDLGSLEQCSQLYLVVQVLRVGRMLPAESSRRPAVQRFRRPFGCAALNIGDVLCAGRTAEAGPERELTVRLQQAEERDFWQLHELVIRQASKASVISGQGNYGVVLSLRLLQGSLAQLRRDSPLLLKHSAVTRKLGFPDVIMPGDVRNDLYLTLERGEFERGGKSTGKNIEVCVMVVRDEGRVLEECIVSAGGQPGRRLYNSLILYHNNAPRWNETIRLAVPIDSFTGSHLRLEFSHCSSTKEKGEKKLFGFAFACLMDDEGATIRDGTHELCVYKCDDRHKLLNPACYLSLPWHTGLAQEPAGGNHHFTRTGRELVCVQTLLCSTKLTQNIDLLSLLKWKQSPDRIVETLTRMMKLKGEEIVKFLQDVLDSLFSMFSTEDGNSTQHSGLVFQVLVSIFSHLQDSKFEHFRPVVDAYVNGHFAAALVYKGLISCVRHYADQVSVAEKQEPLVKCFRSLEFIFRFVIQSRLLFAQQSGGQNEESFRTDLYSLFNAFNKMLSTSTEAATGTQVAMLHSVPAVFVQLRAVLSDIEIARRLSLMLESLPREAPTIVAQAKLAAMRTVAGSPLFQDQESRRLLLQTACKHLRHHVSHGQELRLCTDLLGELLTILQTLQVESGADLHREVEIVSVYLLDTLTRAVLTLESSSPAAGGGQRGRLVAALASLLRLMAPRHYCHLWDEVGDSEQLTHFLLRLMAVFRELVTEQMFPKDWCVLHMTVNKVILNTLTELAIPLRDRFLEGKHFSQQLWLNYLTLSVTFLTQPALQLETFSEVKREKLLQKYQDMRVLMGFQLLSMWSLLGEHKGHFVPALVGPLLEVTLVPETELRRATLPVFYDMMEAEQNAKGCFKQVETELIDKLDILVSENKGDDEYRRLFDTILMERVNSCAPAWREAGVGFVSSVTRLLERLLDYRQVMEGDENRDKRMSCTVNLLNFYKNEINRAEMYQRYIYKLHDLHVSAENYVEAAFALKLHADQLEWSTRVLHADLRFPVQCEWQRKEQLLNLMVDYLDRGKCWEAGIPLLKELAEKHETKIYDYSKLSEVLRTMARFYDQIMTQLRPEPEYFRVGFYGQGFPLFVRNKVFVYRGLEYERIAAFTQRLQTEFPAGRVMTSLAPPEPNLLNADGQWLQICNVRPVSRDVAGLQGIEVPEKIRAYYLVNDIDTFRFDRPVHRGTVDRENEFKTLWLERTTLQTEAPLPGILRWFPVTSSRREMVSPIQHACETVQTANRQLRQLIAQHSAPGAPDNVSPLSMRLQGMIDAAVNGGIANFQEAFFTGDFASQHPELAAHIPTLKALIQEELAILEHGLKVHGELAPPAVQPLHRRLRQCFQQLRQSAAASCSLPAAADSPGPARLSRHNSHRRSGGGGGDKPSILSTPLPPVPNEKRAPGGAASSSCRSSRSSSSSCSVYGHLVAGDSVEDDSIYSRPSEWADSPGRGSLGSQGSAAVRRHDDYIVMTCGKGDGDGVPDRPPKRASDARSWTESPRLGGRRSQLSDWDPAAPPLPPKPPEKRHTTSVSSVTCNGVYENPPSLPSRFSKKVSAPALSSSGAEREAGTPPPLPPKLPASPAVSVKTRTPSPATVSLPTSDRGSLADSDSPPDFEPPPPPPADGAVSPEQGDGTDCGTYKVLDTAQMRAYRQEANYKFFVSPGRICADVAGINERPES